MTHEDVFLADILERPEEDLPRRIYADWLLDRGAFRVERDGRFSVDFAKVKDGVASLVTEIMTTQATGDYARAKALLGKYVVIRPEVKAMLDGLNDVPVDIEPHFATELN